MDEEFITELQAEITDLLNQWNPNPNGADY